MDTIALLEAIERSGRACSESLCKVEAVYELWQPLREATIASLNSVADELDKGNREVTDVTIGASVAGIVGGTAAAIAAAPLPRRVSLPLVTAGAVALSVTSGATNLGKGVAFGDTKRWLLEVTKKKCMEDKTATERLQACIEELNTNVKEIKKICIKIRERQHILEETQRAIESDESSDDKMLQAEFEELSEGASAIAEFIKSAITDVQILPERAGNLKTALKAILKLPKTYMLLRRVSLLQAKALSSIASSSLLLGGAVTGSVAVCTEVGLTAGTAFAIISIFINSFELVVACAHRSKGSKTREAQDLRDICKNLQQEKEDFDSIYSKLQEQLMQEEKDFVSKLQHELQLQQQREQEEALNARFHNSYNIDTYRHIDTSKKKYTK